MEDYRFPLRGLRPDEAEALLVLGVPGVLRGLVTTPRQILRRYDAADG